MRAIVVTILLIPGLLFAMKSARADEDKTAAVATTATATAEEKDQIVLPPGFRPKKRGKFTLYCRKEQVIGTRFEAEKCYDESGIREIVRAQRDDQQKVDQMRRICGSLEACGGG